MKYIVVRKLYLFNVYLARVMMLRRKRKSNEMRNELKQTQKFQSSVCNDYQTWLADKRCWLEFNTGLYSRKLRLVKPLKMKTVKKPKMNI